MNQTTGEKRLSSPRLCKRLLALMMHMSLSDSRSSRARGVLQFSLRSIFLGTLLVALLCSWVATRIDAYDTQHAILEQLESSWAAREAEDIPWIEKRPGAPSWLKYFVPEEKFYVVHCIHFPLDIRNEDLRCISQFPRLDTVDFFLSDVTDSQLACLAGTQIRSLALDCTGITDHGLLHIGTLRHLENLDLEGTEVRGPGLVHLRELPRLEALDLSYSKCGNEALEHVGQLKSLHRLQLRYLPISDSALQHIAILEKLEFLDLGHTPVTDEGLAYLARMPNLRQLWLGCPKVTDKGLLHVSKIISLDSVCLEGTTVTHHGIRRLTEQRPQLQVHSLVK